jgi:DnaJ-class molecular chaperone
MKTEQCFTIFNIEANTSLKEVKRAYKNLASTCHPDKYYNDPILKQKAEEKMKEINTAYAMLTDRLQEIDVEQELDNDHSERRRHPRNPCLLAVNHTTKNRSYSSLHDSIEDISALGVFIRTNEYYQVGQSVKLDFSLPKFGDLLGLSGKVTRLTSEGVAVEFLISTKYQKFIAAFM